MTKQLILASMATAAIGMAAAGCSTKHSTVETILANPVDDSHVTMQGHISGHVEDDKYTFTDGTGEIIVEIDEDEFPQRKPVPPDTLVELYGEVEKDKDKDPKIDVKRVKIVPDEKV